MTEATRPPDSTERERILVLLPYGREEALVRRALRGAPFQFHTCSDLPALLEAVQEGTAGAVLLCDRVLTPGAAERLQAVLDAQPAWSDLPLLVLAKAERAADFGTTFLQNLSSKAYVSVLERPLHPRTLEMALQAAIRARRRQYQVRDLLRKLETWTETLEDRVEERTGQVRELASRLTMAEQKERRRIAHVLHDGLQQLLFGIRMQIEFLRKDAESGDREAVFEEGTKLNELLGRAIATARQLTVDLSPPVLREEGLADTLAWLVTHMKELYGLEVELQAAHPYPLPDEDLRVLLFQVVRELLFNVVKHAGTDRATVTLREEGPSEDRHLVIEVTDRGRGFDPAETRAEHGEGFGLFSVRERLNLLGGRVETDSVPGKGTRTVVHLPVAPERPASS